MASKEVHLLRCAEFFVIAATFSTPHSSKFERLGVYATCI